MNKKEKEICCGRNKPSGMVGILHAYSYPDYYKCQSKASMFENGRWYCKRHAPSKIKEREAKSEERMWEKYRRIKKEFDERQKLKDDTIK